MLHYIYKIIFLQGFPEGRYYLGKRSFGGDDIAKDTYSGSGSFCKAYFKACGKKLGETYLKEIVETNTCAKINASREAELIGDLWKTDPLCMNRFPGGYGGDAIEAKAVNQYDLDGNYINTHVSETRAAEAVGLKDASGIGKACINKVSTAGGFIWRFETEPLKPSELDEIIIREKPVKQYTETGEFIQSWDRIQDASLSLNIDATSISAICKHTHKSRHTAGGFVWCYANEEPVINKVVPYHGKIVVCKYTLDGNFLEKFESFKAAADSVNGKWQCIQTCCKKLWIAYNFIWRFEDHIITDSELDDIKVRTKKYKIQKISPIGELIEEFDTPTKAGNSVGVPYQYIQYAIKTGRVHYGYYWRRQEVIQEN